MARADNCSAIVAACHALSEKGVSAAADLIAQSYPFVSPTQTARHYGPRQKLSLFIRDGFLDRYSGEHLLLPPVLDVLHLAMPASVPWTSGWKASATHPSFNDLVATVDHVEPVTRNGIDSLANWVTTSMAHNFAKSNFTLQELGWSLHPPGSFAEWDGLSRWFVAYYATHPELAACARVRQWYRPTVAALAAA